MSTATKQIEELANTEYKYGFVTDVEQDIVPVGLNEDVVRLISSKKGEPHWQNVKYEAIVSGFCKEVFRELPMEFAVEAQKLLGISLEGSVG